MCDTCGCNVTDGNRHLVEAGGRLARTEDGRAAVKVLQGLLTENDHQAAHNRMHFDARGILALNLMSSPGAGKTALLEATIDALEEPGRIVVIEGDLETENDAERIRARGVQAVQIATGSACHLDAVEIVFIENVGNLVCPASFDLGQHANVTLLSVPEGDDKPAKYPVMFRAADLVLLTKTDLLPVLDDFDPARAEAALRAVGSKAPLLHVASRKNLALQGWLDWLEDSLAAQRARLAEGSTRRAPVQSAHDAHHHHEHPHGDRHRHVHGHATDEAT
jgi:hydrogenase nickel incorporation protein HypB